MHFVRSVFPELDAVAKCQLVVARHFHISSVKAFGGVYLIPLHFVIHVADVVEPEAAQRRGIILVDFFFDIAAVSFALLVADNSPFIFLRLFSSFCASLATAVVF